MWPRFVQDIGRNFIDTELQSVLVVRSVCTPAEAVAGFDEMVAQTQRKYYMLGGKGGVGKTSCAASLAVKFANHGHPTIVVSTDPAHSLSDSFDQVFICDFKLILLLPLYVNSYVTTYYR